MRRTRAGLQVDTPVLLALAVWMCTLPIAALAVPLLGWKVAMTAAAGLLVGILILCWALCFGAIWWGLKRDMNRNEPYDAVVYRTAIE